MNTLFSHRIPDAVRDAGLRVQVLEGDDFATLTIHGQPYIYCELLPATMRELAAALTSACNAIEAGPIPQGGHDDRPTLDPPPHDIQPVPTTEDAP
jgi:hypothetical protein